MRFGPGFRRCQGGLGFRRLLTPAIDLLDQQRGGVESEGGGLVVPEQGRIEITLDPRAELIGLADVALYSLQTGRAAADIAGHGCQAFVTDLGGKMRDFADTAAVIGQLDLIISVDTAVAHLAGAMGKPVWVALPHPGDWRWMQDGDTSPWYPTMRLFRQSAPGDWATVFEALTKALAVEAGGGRA